MLNKCPGQMSCRSLDSIVVPCPDCGRLVEFFTDEPKRRCRCGRVLLRVWRDGAHMKGDKLYYYQAIHQESDVIPENVDVVRAMFQLEDDNVKSMEMTDKALGLR